MLLCIAVRIGVAGGKKSQEFFGCDQGHAQPGSKLFVSLECFPSLFLARVRDQYALLFDRYPLQERRSVSDESQRGSIGFVRGLGTELFTQRSATGEGRCRSDADGIRQDPLLQPAGNKRCARKSRHQSTLSLSHQSTGPGPTC